MFASICLLNYLFYQLTYSIFPVICLCWFNCFQSCKIGKDVTYSLCLVALKFFLLFWSLQEEVKEERDERFIQVQAPAFSIQLFSPVNWQVNNNRFM